MKSVQAAAVGAALAVALGIKFLAGLIKGKAYDGLSSVISFSSKLIAASRAVESSESHPLVTDPLAEKMAGAAALASSRQRAQPAPKDSERAFKVGKMAIRTRWFDDQIEAALGMPVAAYIPAALRDMSAPSGVDLDSYIWSHPAGHEPRQLVMLGAGMDSRPWRMKLPADLRWFELDQPDVVAAKQQLLKEMGAEVPRQDDANSMPDGQPGSPAPSGLTRHLSLDSVQHPLRCASWTAVACDLSDPSWADALLAAGFQPSKPTVWVAEGLLMYLQQEQVEALLSKMAGLSPAGSAFVGISVTQAVIDRLRAKGGAGGSKNGGSKGGSSLMDTWAFGCPQDPTEFLGACGWELQKVTHRASMASALGIARELWGFPAGEEGGGPPGSLFMVATPSSTAAGQ